MSMPTVPDRRIDGQPPLSAPEAISRRRATRHFDPDRPVPDDVLKRILHLATLAPSGFNLQPWRFLVVRSERNRQKLRGCAFNQPKVAEAPVVVIVLGYHHPHRSHLDAMVERALRWGRSRPRGRPRSARRPSGRWSTVPTQRPGPCARRCSPRPP